MQLALRFFAFLVLLCFSAVLHAAEEIKIASTGPGLSTLPLEIAARKGFFRDEGFEVLTITMRTNIAVNALLTRNVDYATPSTSTIKAAIAGLPVKTIAVLFGRPDYFLTVKRDVKLGKRSQRQTHRHRQLRRRRRSRAAHGRQTRWLGPRPRSHPFANGRSRRALRFANFRQRRRDDLNSALQPASGKSRLQRPPLVRRALRVAARRARRSATRRFRKIPNRSWA